jgi:hypothetical protein
MADYNRLYNLTVKDSLPTGNSAKVIKGAELDAELNAVAAAIASKSDSNSPTFTGTPAAPTASYGTSTTQIATTAFVQQALQALYPVGSIYINATSSTNPATLFGFGTWVAFGEGRVIVGQNASDALFDTLEETGGSKDAIAVSHTHGVSTITGTAASAGAHTHSITDPGHTHTYQDNVAGGGIAAGGGALDSEVISNTGSSSTGISIQSGGAHTHTVSLSGNTDSTGSSGTNANVQPYIVCKVWKRVS